MTIFSKLLYKFNTVPIKIPYESFLELYKFILKFIWKSNQTIIARETLKSVGLLLLDIKIYYKTFYN